MSFQAFGQTSQPEANGPALQSPISPETLQVLQQIDANQGVYQNAPNGGGIGSPDGQGSNGDMKTTLW